MVAGTTRRGSGENSTGIRSEKVRNSDRDQLIKTVSTKYVDFAQVCTTSIRYNSNSIVTGTNHRIINSLKIKLKIRNKISLQLKQASNISLHFNNNNLFIALPLCFLCEARAQMLVVVVHDEAVSFEFCPEICS